MGTSKSPNSENISAQCRKELVAKIVQRSKAIGISKSRYVALILEKWEADGEKPVSQADRALYVLGKSFPEAETITPTPPRYGKTSQQAGISPRATVIKKHKPSTDRK